MSKRLKPYIAILGAAVVLVTAGWALAECPIEPTSQNFLGAGRVTCPCFAGGEEAGAVFPVPAEHFPIEVLRLGVGWGSAFGGNPQQFEQALHIYNGQLPDPGVPVYTVVGPQLTDGVINEFNLEIADDIFINSAPVAATLEFQYSNAGITYAPSVVSDGNGCTPGMNLVKADGLGWVDACHLGITGDWVFHLVYRQVNCVSGVDDREYTVTTVPAKAQLHDCYPNPFNPQTLISFDMPAAGNARLEIYSLAGKRVATLVNGEVGAGRNEEVWYGKDDEGRPVPSGVYFYKLETREFRESKRMVLLK